MSSIYFESNSNRPVTDRSRRVDATSNIESTIAPLAMPGLILGLILLGLGMTALVRLGDWVGNYGSVLVVLAYVLYMAAAVRLVLWGAITVWSLHRR
ncbi:hypothetical protein ACFWVM_00130 [Nocardia fluminea]|uniref:hypothetical protein n=1 Tax=Nocardia fluminea TaxID=134984 RepID=UPI0036573532